VRPAVRRAERRILVEGPQALSLAADRLEILELFVTRQAAERQGSLVADLAASGVPVHLVDPAAAAALSETVTPQGIVAVAVPPSRSWDRLPPASRLVAVLVEPRDPGNLGTIVRTADAAGADAVVVAGDSADPYGGKAIRASAGSVFTVPVIDAGPPADLLPALAERGLRPLATAGSASRDLDDLLDSGELLAPTAWLFGNEAHGLPPDVITSSPAWGGTAVRVPVYGAAESLNVAAAAAVCLYASARAQRKRPGEGVGG
jgi:TrmH family RNA methyltransferase